MVSPGLPHAIRRTRCVAIRCLHSAAIHSSAPDAFSRQEFPDTLFAICF